MKLKHIIRQLQHGDLDIEFGKTLVVDNERKVKLFLRKMMD